MDDEACQLYNASIHRVLHNYQTNALRTLNGPTPAETWTSDIPSIQSVGVLDLRKRFPVTDPKYLKEMEHYHKAALQVALPIQPPPFFSAMDTSRCVKSETLLEGETIACFVVGGEKRLCLPQILHTVLRDFTLPEIDSICDDLHIFCSRCNDEQLHMLKILRILPLTAQSCGLVTKTDAERLCHSLIYKNSCKPLLECRKPSLNCFRVYHECFGKCTGIFHPESYTSPDAKCIICSQCSVAFTPSKFVCHSHKSLENRTCHWGFDSFNWRSYLMLAKSQDDTGKLQDMLEQLKARFDHDRSYKRRQSPIPHKPKRSKYDESTTSCTGTTTTTSQQHLTSSNRPPSVSSSAFRPWSPGSLKDPRGPPTPQAKDSVPQAIPAYLQTGPPVLLNPERVVRHSETDRYERHFAPNVSLAPIAPLKAKDREDGHPDETEVPPLDIVSPNSSHNSHLSSPQSEISMEEPLLLESTLERELDLVRQALSKCDVSGPDADLTDKSFQEFSLLRARHEEQWGKAIRAQTRLTRDVKLLQQDMEVLQKEAADATLRHKQTLHELKKLQQETEKRFKEEHEHKEHLLMEIDSLQKDKEKCLKAKRDDDNNIQDMEAMYHNLQQEVLWYQQELARLRLEHGVKTAVEYSVKSVVDYGVKIPVKNYHQNNNHGHGPYKHYNSTQNHLPLPQNHVLAQNHALLSQNHAVLTQKHALSTSQNHASMQNHTSLKHAYNNNHSTHAHHSPRVNHSPARANHSPARSHHSPSHASKSPRDSPPPPTHHTPLTHNHTPPTHIHTSAPTHNHTTPPTHNHTPPNHHTHSPPTHHTPSKHHSPPTHLTNGHIAPLDSPKSAASTPSPIHQERPTAGNVTPVAMTMTSVSMTTVELLTAGVTSNG